MGYKISATSFTSSSCQSHITAGSCSKNEHDDEKEEQTKTPEQTKK